MTKANKAGPAPQPTKFVCAVCDQTRPLAADGKPQFVPAGGGAGNKICFPCVNAEDERNLKEGKGITLSLVWSSADQRWMGVNPTGKVRVPLFGAQEGAGDAQLLAAPMFEHGGRRWRGRFYPASGTAHFTPLGAPTRAGRAGAAARGKAPTAAKGKAARDKGKAAPAAAAL